jgi:hypothetical protein
MAGGATSRRCNTSADPEPSCTSAFILSDSDAVATIVRSSGENALAQGGDLRSYPAACADRSWGVAVCSAAWTQERYVPPAEYEARYYEHLQHHATIDDGAPTVEAGAAAPRSSTGDADDVVAGGILQPAPDDDRRSWGTL